MSNLMFTSAHQLAQMIRERDVSAVEVLDAYNHANHQTQLTGLFHSKKLLECV